jgi:CBS domain-containing protein
VSAIASSFTACGIRAPTSGLPTHGRPKSATWQSRCTKVKWLVPKCDDIMEMAQYLREIMTQKPMALQASDSLSAAARTMHDENIGAIVVLESGQICGILTARDIVVRALAEERQLAHTTVGEICSRELTTMSPTDTIGDAVAVMRDKAIRRLPVLEGGRPVGIVSLGDLAIQRDPQSVLGGISAAPSNR